MPELNQNLVVASLALVGILGYRMLRTGPFDTMWYRIFGTDRVNYPIKTVKLDEGYSEVISQFMEAFDFGDAVGAGLVIYTGKKKVVEVYGGYSNFELKQAYDENTLQQVASVSKNIVSLVIAIMVDKKLLSYETKVSSVWPEFGQGNKEEVTVEDVLKHQAGLAYFTEKVPLEAKYDLDLMAQYLVKQKHIFDKEPIRAYHGFNRGFILNEIVRRVDPQKRTIGQIYQQDLNPTAGVEVYLGLPNREDGTNSLISRRAWWYSTPLIDNLMALLLPQFLTGNRWPSGFKLISAIANPHMKHLSKFKMSAEKDFPNSADILDCEIPSSNLHSGAHSLAKLAAYLANFGTLHGVQLLSEKVVREATSGVETKFCHLMQLETTMTKGGFGVFTISELGDQYKFYGWPGFGGSLLLFNLDYSFAMVYTCNAALFEFYLPRIAKKILVIAFKSHLKTFNKKN